MFRLVKTAASLLTALCLLVAPAAHADQTLVFLRHGEKPAAGLGQLSCKGLNRSLALPRVLRARFDAPVAIFASNPSALKEDKGVPFSYVRPLATIEPTAIDQGLAVNTQFGFLEVGALESAITAPAFRDSTVFVAWEHHLARQAVVDLLKSLGSTEEVPAWADDDFDSLLVLRVKWQDDRARAVRFERLPQGLNDLPATCPF